MAAFTSPRRRRRPISYSGPGPRHCAQSTMPAVPSMSLEMKTRTAVLVSAKAGGQVVLGRRRPGRVVSPHEGLDSEDLREQLEAEVEEEAVVRLAGVGGQCLELRLGERCAVDVGGD